MDTLLPDSDAIAWIEVNLGAIRHNFRILRARARAHVQTFGVIKADAYGHGALEVAKVLIEEGVDALCVARLEEAVELRRGGITHRLLVFAPPLDQQADSLLNLDAEAVVCAREHVDALVSASRRLARPCKVHVKVDVGMGRLGVRPQDAAEFIRSVKRFSEIQISGVMSHLPCADMPEARELTLKQIRTFVDIKKTLQEAQLGNFTYHMANSAALLDYPEAHFDAVRPGISLYGQYPSLEIGYKPDLRPAMSMKSRIVYLKDVPTGVGLSYGHTFTTVRPSRIATVALGYADGYPRHASNRTTMAVRGRLAPQVGRVCMDLCLLDVTDIPNVRIGDVVLAFGQHDSVTLRAEEVAAQIGTIGYELTTRYGRRLPRFFVNS